MGATVRRSGVLTVNADGVAIDTAHRAAGRLVADGGALHAASFTASRAMRCGQGVEMGSRGTLALAGFTSASSGEPAIGGGASMSAMSGFAGHMTFDAAAPRLRLLHQGRHEHR